MKKQKIHRIGNSKEPTTQQILKMAENLRNKRKGYATIQVHAWAHTSGSDPYAEYYISMEGDPGFYFKTWPEALEHYRKLMKGK